MPILFSPIVLAFLVLWLLVIEPARRERWRNPPLKPKYATTADDYTAVQWVARIDSAT